MDHDPIFIEELDLSVRSYNGLTHAGIVTLDDLLPLTEEDLMNIRNLGARSVREICEKRAEYEHRKSCEIQPASPVFESDDEKPAGADLPLASLILNTPVTDIGFSVRAENALLRANIPTVKQLLKLNDGQISLMRNVGEKTIGEFIEKRGYYQQMIDSAMLHSGDEPDIHTAFDAWLESPEHRGLVRFLLRSDKVMLSVLDLLSPKIYNLLLLAGYRQLYQVIFMSEDELINIPQIDSDSAREIRRMCKLYLREHKDKIIGRIEYTVDTLYENEPPQNIDRLLITPAYRGRVLQYLREHDVPLKNLDLPNRALNALMRAGYAKISGIVLLDQEDLMHVQNLGIGALEKTKAAIRRYLESIEQPLLTFCLGKHYVPNEDGLKRLILDLYRPIGFGGLHLPEILEKLNWPENEDPSPVKKAVGKLIAEGKLEYTDYLCYRVYPSFVEYVKANPDIDERGTGFILKKLGGKTLEEIGSEEGLTRERVRQIIKKNIDKAHARLLSDTGMTRFDEDYYQYFFSSYAVDRKTCIEWLGLPETVYNYLDLFNKRGYGDLSEALDDPELDAGMKIKIRNYLNRDTVYFDGRYIEKKRSSLIEHVLRTYCNDEISSDGFVTLYNDFLKRIDIPAESELFLTDENNRYIVNRLADSRNVLWKQNRMMRYYDVDGRDYAELFDGLGLDGYENTELSTLKLFNTFPKLMERYDIRDHYELHNLIRKVLLEGSYHDFHCGRMPMIRFGTFDRSGAILDLIIENAPISQNDLLDLIYDEYGFDRGTAAGSFLNEFQVYYHAGVYSIDPVIMPLDQREALLAELTEDFYYTDEVRQIYLRLFPHADPEAVSPYNLKSMGFQVLSKYVLRNWSSLEAYFKHLLLDRDIVDLMPLRKRFCNIQMWYQTFTSLKKEYRIIEFEPDKIISITKLASAGVTPDMLHSFCDDVFAYTTESEYFTISSLKKKGFRSALFDLGFENFFYANLLCSDDRFSFSSMFGIHLLFNGKEPVSTRSFLEYRIRGTGSIDMIDLINELTEDYGCRIEMRSDITQKLKNTDIFYDTILDRLYENIELYYRELDNAEGL